MVDNSSYITRVVNRRPFGWEFTDVTKTFHFKFEEGADPFYWHDVFTAYWAFPLYVGALYIFAIFGIQWYMKDKPAYKLQMPLFWWNLILGIFSILGFVRCLPAFVEMLMKPNGFYMSVCEKKNFDIPSGFWMWAFVMSKFWELGDTIFIVLRKRPLVFLQWYHHLVTMSATWILAAYMEPVTRWYTVLNYGVHSLMYPYFALKAIHVSIPSKIANLITTLQLAQMIMGFAVNMLSLYFRQLGYDCFRYDISIRVFGAVYGSFLILFGKLFFNAVIRSKRARAAAKKID